MLLCKPCSLGDVQNSVDAKQAYISVAQGQSWVYLLRTSFLASATSAGFSVSRCLSTHLPSPHFLLCYTPNKFFPDVGRRKQARQDTVHSVSLVPGAAMPKNTPTCQKEAQALGFRLDGFRVKTSPIPDTSVVASSLAHHDDLTLAMRSWPLLAGIPGRLELERRACACGRGETSCSSSSQPTRLALAPISFWVKLHLALSPTGLA